MEIGELVNVDIPDPGKEGKCPFSHDKPKPKEKNELGGIGTELGKNMEAGKGICHESRKGKAHSEGPIELDPRKRPKKEKIMAVTIEIDGEVVTLGERNRPLPYPLTCAAHHLIPAQEALKEHEILKYMCKKDEKQDFRNGKNPAPAPVSGSKVWGNVGYNVNGCHNGVWLPGNYAVGAGTGGAQLWKSRADARRQDKRANQNWVARLDDAVADWDRGDDDDEEEMADAMKRALGKEKKKKFMLAGQNHHISVTNPKWAYVMSAMDAIGGQFHDRHEDYSGAVQEYLRKMAAAYKKQHTDAVDNCTDCANAERPDDATKSQVGPPFGIVGRLKTAAEFFRRYLLATKGVLGAKETKKSKKVTTAENIYTSGWIYAWFEHYKKP